MDEKKIETSTPPTTETPKPTPKKERRPRRRTNDPNRFVWVPGDLEVVDEK